MPRTKYPDLDHCFWNALPRVFDGAEVLGWPEIVARLRSLGPDYGILPEHIEDIARNSANYADRAKRSGYLISFGTRRGYGLGASAQGRPSGMSLDGEDVVTDTPTRVPSRGAPPAVDGVRREYEAFVHFIGTVALCRHFDSRVMSLRTKESHVRWGNPDMLMVRLRESVDLEALLSGHKVDTSLLRKIDAGPEYVVSSMELKFGAGSDRRMLFGAISETAANSSWANEAWLVFCERADAESAALEPDVLSLAARAGVSLGEIACTGQTLSFREHYRAPLRTSIGFAELAGDRTPLIVRACELLAQFEKSGSFADADGNVHQARELLSQALENVRIQKSF